MLLFLKSMLLLFNNRILISVNDESITDKLRDQNLTFISTIEANNTDEVIDMDEDDFQFFMDQFKREFETLHEISDSIEVFCLPALIVGAILLGLTLLTCCSCGDKTQSHEFRLGQLQTRVSEESLRKMKAELVEMLVREHQKEMEERAAQEPEMAVMTKPVMEEVIEEESSEEEEEVIKPQVIFIPPALQPQPFDPTAVAR